MNAEMYARPLLLSGTNQKYAISIKFSKTLQYQI
jgi:hypothetical protein